MRRNNAFTLVELLVMIGIIVLLIAILLPVLSRAREQANLVKCLATLRNMGQAAQMHASEHQGFMPVAGEMTPRPEVLATPAGLNDRAMKKYVYWQYEMPRPMPLPAALAIYM